MDSLSGIPHQNHLGALHTEEDRQAPREGDAEEVLCSDPERFEKSDDHTDLMHYNREERWKY